MQSFTFGTDEFMEAIALERMRTGENYPITLNDSAFRILTTILRDIAVYGQIDRHKLNDLVGWDSSHDTTEPVEDWAWQFLSDIGETLGVEGI